MVFGNKRTIDDVYVVDEDNNNEGENINNVEGNNNNGAENSNNGGQNNNDQVPVHNRGDGLPLSNEVTYLRPASGKNPGGSKVWVCKHCNKQHTTTYSRIHTHFFGPEPGKKAEIERCKVMMNDREKYISLLNRVKEAEKAGVSKSLKNSVISKKQNTSSKNPIEQGFGILARNAVDLKIMRCLGANGIPFNVLRNPQFHEMVSAIQKAPPGYKPPSSEKARTVLLDECARDVEKEMTPIKDTWFTQGVSIVSDGWSNVKRNPLINVIAVNSRGATFMYADDFSGEEKTGAAIAKFLLTAIENIGPSNVLQVVTDNAANCKAAGKEIEKVAAEELKEILNEVDRHILCSENDLSPIKTIAGGSVTNTIRGLAAGFGISSGVIGAYGDDEQGALFLKNMNFYGVNISRLRLKDQHTAQCVCLVDALGNRTMRPCIATAAKIQAGELKRKDFIGSKWLVLRYSIYNLEVINAAIRIAKQEGLLISLDLASFEMVRKFKAPLLQLLESGNIDLCFANEDEAAEILSGEQVFKPEDAVNVLGKYCQWAVVTLGANGCIARHKKEVVRVPAVGLTKAVDATGAGDLFAGGFLYGLVNGMSLEECCKIGSCSGGSVIQSLGGEVSPGNWEWMYKQLRTNGIAAPHIVNRI